MSEVPTGDSFEAEEDLSLWASEMGLSYTIGSQDASYQNPLEMSNERVLAHISELAKDLRQKGLLPNPDEVALEEILLTREQLRALPEVDLWLSWYPEMISWFDAHPEALVPPLPLDES